MEQKKLVFITGSSQGIGQVLAESFAREQYQVIINCRSDSQKVREVQQKIINAGGAAEIVVGDISKESDVTGMFKKIIEQFGKIDVLINNAAIIHEDLIMNVSDEKWENVLNANLKGMFLCVKAVSRHMMKARQGSIINIGSIQGVRGGKGTAAYAASKGGVISFTKSAAWELGKRGITVNAVLPGYQATGMENEQYEKWAKEMSVLNNTTDMKELMQFIIFLSTMKTISGQVFNWDSRII